MRHAVQAPVDPMLQLGESGARELRRLRQTAPDREWDMFGFNRRELVLGTSAAFAAGSILPARAATAVRATYGGQDVLYAANMVAFELGLGREEGLDLKLNPADAGAKARQILAAGEVDFAHGDATHPLQLSRRGKPAKMLMATEPEVLRQLVDARGREDWRRLAGSSTGLTPVPPPK